MLLSSALFYLFAAVIVLSAVGVIVSKNPVHAVLFLVLTFFTSAALWILLKAEFLALILVLVYVGAVMVLFLFVVMMMDIQKEQLKALGKEHLAIAAGIGIIILAEVVLVVIKGFMHEVSVVPDVSLTQGQVGPLGHLLFTKYLFAVEVVAIVLLVALVGAVTLTIRKRKDAIYTDASDAVKVKPSDRLRLVKVQPEVMTGNKEEK